MDTLALVAMTVVWVGTTYLRWRSTPRPIEAAPEDENRRTATSPGSERPLYDTRNPRDLHQALLWSSLPEVQRLVRSGEDLEHRYEDEKTALHLACESSSLEVFEFVLNCGANPAARDRAGRTPLLVAVEKGRVDILKFLMRKEIDASARDNEGRTAVSIAAEHGDVGILQELYKARRVVPAEHALAIQKARRCNNLEAVEFLEKEGVRLRFQPKPELTLTVLDRRNLEIAPDSMASHCQTLYSIVNRQIFEPVSLSTYVNRIIEASKDISEGPHSLTPEESQLFATLYRAIFDDFAKSNKASAESHLTTVKIIAKRLGLESEIEMNRSFGPEPRLYALSVRSTSRRIISQFLRDIRRYLVKNKHADSFGSLFNVGISTNTKVTCCVFASKTPNKFIAPTELICEGTSVPVLIIEDSINEAVTSNRPPSSWVNKPVRHAVEIDLSGYSVGQRGDMEEAGSFGFYGKSDNQVIHGFTAAHCTPRAEHGSIIVSPSTRELTGRLEVAVQYTSFAPEPRRRLPARETEVERLLIDWISEDSDEGCKIRERVESDEVHERRIKLHGLEFGIVSGKSATYMKDMLEEHNRRLDQQQALSFVLPEDEDGLGERLSRIEWCCFAVLGDRFGGNRLNSDTRQDAVVRGITLLKPDMEVSKIGRTTGETEGKVNGCVIQRWVDNYVTTEIGVQGNENGAFADVGDSGSLVVTATDDEPYGVAMLIGKNVLGNLGLVSPLWAVLEDVNAKLGQGINFYTE